MKLPGFRAVKWKTKKGTEKVAYYYRRTTAQGRKDTPLGTDYYKAIRKYSDLRELEIEPPADTLAFIHREYIAWAKNTSVSGLAERTIEDRIRYWGKPDSGYLCTAFGETHPNDFEPEWAMDYFESRSSQKMAKKELKYLQLLYNWGRARGLINCQNPFDGIMRHLKVSGGRDIYVEDSWFALTFKHGSQLVKDAMEFTYIAGNRPIETRKSLMPAINDEYLAIDLPKTKKSGLKQKRLKIEGALKDYIDRQRAKPVTSIHLVSDNSGQPLRTVGSKFRREWDEARDKAEAEAKENGLSYTRFQLMDLRAKAATDTCEKYGLEAARCLLGHTTQKQTADYIRSIRGVSARALEAIGA